MSTDRSPSDNASVIPDDPERNEQMRELLDETEYDTELGLELARDAQRLVAGEITEEEFHDRHHEAIVAEFGVDDRPLETLGEAIEEAAGDGSGGGPLDDDGIVDHLTGTLDSIGALDPEGEQSRRDVLKKSGLAAGALSLAAWGTAEGDRSGGADPPASVAAAQEEEDEDDDVQWGMVIDLDRCDGCLGCVEACQEDNQWERGANWLYVLAYEDDRREEEDYLVRPCQHCSNAPCEKVCPVEARHTRDEDGLVLTDYETCIGCRYCQVACPYGVNYFQWGEPDVPEEELDEDHIYDDRGRAVDSRPPKGVMGKCTMCPTRQDGLHGEDKVGTVACMDMCDEMGMRAIHFGDLNDPESRPNEYLRKRREIETGRRPGPETTAEDIHHTSTKDGDVSTFKLLEHMGTDPNVIYVGDEPGPNAEQVEGPVKYGRVQNTVDRRKDVLDRGAAANRDRGSGSGGDDE